MLLLEFVVLYEKKGYQVSLYPTDARLPESLQVEMLPNSYFDLVVVNPRAIRADMSGPSSQDE